MPQKHWSALFRKRCVPLCPFKFIFVSFNIINWKVPTKRGESTQSDYHQQMGKCPIMCCIEKAHTLVTALEINGVSVYRTTSEVAGVQDYDRHSSLLIPASTHPCKRLRNIVGKDRNLKHKRYLYRLRSSGNTNSEEPAPPTCTPKSEGEAAIFGERRSKSRSCLQHFLWICA